MNNLINNVLRRLGFSYDGEDSNSGWDANQEHKWAPSDTNEDAQHRDDRFTSVTTVVGDASTEENNAKRLSDVQKWVTRYQVETDEHGSIVLYHATPKSNAAIVAQTGLPKGTLLETTPEAALFFTCDSKDISRTDVVLYAVHVPPFVLSPGKFGSLLDDLDATFITPVELPTQEEFKKTDAPKETDVMPKAIGWLKRAEELDTADLALSLGVEADTITVKETDDNGGAFDADGTEYRFFWDSEKFEQAAIDRVTEDLNDDPSMFSQEWLQQHITIGDGDRRMIAQEEADNLVDEIFSEEELIERSGESDIEAAREKVRESEYDRIYAELDDPINYFVEEHGMYSVEELMKANFIQIDIESAAAEAVNIDGAAHFLSHEDGNYEETAKGVVYFKES